MLVCLLWCVSGCTTFGRGENESNSNNLATFISDGERLYAEGRIEEAEALFLKAYEISNDEPQLNYRLGNIAFRKGHHDRAAEYFIQVVEKNPRNAKAHFNLATIRLMQAESHFKYYIATTDPKMNIESLSTLIGAIEQYAASTKGN